MKPLIDPGLYYCTRSLRAALLSPTPQVQTEFAQGGEVYRPVDKSYYWWICAIAKANKDKLSGAQKENVSAIKTWADRCWGNDEARFAEKKTPIRYVPPLPYADWLKAREEQPVQWPKEPEYVEDFIEGGQEVELSLPSGQKAYIVPKRTEAGKKGERLEITPRVAFTIKSILDVWGPEAKALCIKQGEEAWQAMPEVKMVVVGDRVQAIIAARENQKGDKLIEDLQNSIELK